MVRLPRIAVATVQPNASGEVACWAILERLTREGRQVQHFFSRATLDQGSACQAITGLPSRYVDAWLMCPGTCREVFRHGATFGDLSVVQGPVNAAGHAQNPLGFSGLVEALELPLVGIVDVRLMSGCHVPSRPANVSALILDGVEGTCSAYRWKVAFEALWNVPVVAAVPAVPELRQRLVGEADKGVPDLLTCRELGRHVIWLDGLERVARLADCRHFPDVPAGRFTPATSRRPLSVAVAKGPAFGGYFPESLDLLEMGGARICEFSPARDEALPSGCDIAYFGCGRPEERACELAANHCLKLALKRFACGGGRIYAEGAGAAYLCREMVLEDGRRYPMAGILPSVATLNSAAPPPRPVEANLPPQTWLGPRNMPLRAYRHERWHLSAPAAIDERGPASATCRGSCDLMTCFHAVASRMYIHFAAWPTCLDSFFAPPPPEPGSGPPSCSKRPWLSVQTSTARLADQVGA